MKEEMMKEEMMKEESTRFISTKGFEVAPGSRNTVEAHKRAVYYQNPTGEYGSFSLTEAQELIEVLQAIIADYPKEPTNEEILNELPVGSVVQCNDEKSRWFKTVEGWSNSRDGLSTKNVSIFNDSDFVISVKYRGDE